MNKIHTRCCIILMTAIAGQTFGGDINPPAGPIEPTMKPLDAIEPRICINELPGSPTAVHVITEPGSYYLTGDVFGEPGKNGIEISLDGLPPGEYYAIPLAIDGNGYGVIGGPGTLDGVTKTSGEPIEDFSLKFCKIRVTSWGGDGVHLEDVWEATFDNVLSNGNGGDGAEIRMKGKDESSSCWIRVSQFHNNGGDGLGVHIDPSGDGTTGDYDVRVVESSAIGNTGDGVSLLNLGMHSVDAYIEELVSSSNTGSGVVIENIHTSLVQSSANGNGGDGVNASTPGMIKRKPVFYWDTEFSRNGGSGSTSDGYNVTVENCSYVGNGLSGASIVNGDTAKLDSARFTDNGVSVGSPGLLCDDVLDITIRDCEASGNTSNGVALKKGEEVRLIGFGTFTNGGNGLLIEDVVGNADFDQVTATGNGGGGIVVESSMGGACGSVALTNCAANNNTASGVELVCTTGGIIRRCMASNNGISGFVVAGSGHVVIENIAAGNSIGGYSVPIPGNTLGPVVDEFAAELNTNPGANYVR